MQQTKKLVDNNLTTRSSSTVFFSNKYVDSIVMKIAVAATPNDIQKMPKARPILDFGERSPNPIVVRVITDM